MRFFLFFLVFLSFSLKEIHSRRFHTKTIKRSEKRQTQYCNVISYDKNAVWKMENFPNPQTDIKMDHCGRKCKPSWICDPHHILEPREADKLDVTIEHIRNMKVSMKSNCSDSRDGYSISIAIVPKLHDGSLAEARNEADRFAYYLHQRSWRFSKCGNDVVVFLSTNESLISISAGAGIRQIITNYCLDTMCKESAIILNSTNAEVALNDLLEKISYVLEHGVCFDKDLHLPNYASLPSEAVIGALGVFAVLFGYGAYVIKKDLDLKAKEKEEALKHSSKRKRRRKLSLQQIKSRRRSSQNAFSLKSKPNNTKINILVTNEDGILKEESDEEGRSELMKTNKT